MSCKRIGKILGHNYVTVYKRSKVVDSEALRATLGQFRVLGVALTLMRDEQRWILELVTKSEEIPVRTYCTRCGHELKTKEDE